MVIAFVDIYSTKGFKCCFMRHSCFLQKVKCFKVDATFKVDHMNIGNVYTNLHYICVMSGNAEL